MRPRICILALAACTLSCSERLDLEAIGLGDEPTSDPVDARVLVDATGGSAGADGGAVAATMDAVLRRAARAPGSRVRAYFMADSAPPLLLLDVVTPALPRRPRARGRRIDAWVIEQRERALGALAPLLDGHATRSPVAESIMRVAAVDAAASDATRDAADVHVVVLSDLRETALGNFERRATTPTVEQVLRRAARRRLFQAGDLTGVSVHLAGFTLLPVARRPLDCSIAQQARIEDRFRALCQRAGATSIEFTTGPPRFDAEDSSEGEEE